MVRAYFNFILYLCTMLMNEATLVFIRRHADGDVRRLALQGVKDPDVDLPMALQQIAGRQTARRKLPSWAAAEGVVYPPHLNMEQCSSEQTARYKAGIVGRGSRYVDLTGGLGVDFFFMSQAFSERIYVEQNADLCAVAEHNFRLLGLTCSVCCSDAVAFLQQMRGTADVVYLDPARRNEHGGRTYGIADCTPNVLELLPLLKQKAATVVLKLSPMLDWRKAVDDLGGADEVHIVSVGNECKELVLVLGDSRLPVLYCVNDGHAWQVPVPRLSAVSEQKEEAAAFLYEPNASIMKAGCFEAVEQTYPVRQLAANSHLFVSAVRVDDFPGRAFCIESVAALNKQELRTALAAIDRANITVRNFPMTVEQLRKKLKLKDGGTVYLFATTLADDSHKLFICRKIG